MKVHQLPQLPPFAGQKDRSSLEADQRKKDQKTQAFEARTFQEILDSILGKTNTAKMS